MQPNAFILLLGLLFLLPLASAATNTSTITLGSQATVATVTALNITAFSISSSNFSSGTFVDFTTVLTNNGNTLVVAQPRIYIYQDSTFIEAVNYSNATIAGGETQTLTRSWDSGSQSAGSYTAYVNATFDGNATNTLNLSFTITRTTLPPAEPVDVSAKAGKPLFVVKEIPTVEIPVVPPGGTLQLLRYPLYQEVLSGSHFLTYPLLKNPLSDTVTVRVSASGPAASLAGEVHSLLFSAEETRSIPISFAVPSGIASGYYLLDIDMFSDLPTFSYPLILRVQEPPSPGQPLVSRDVVLDLKKGISVITLTVSNTGPKTLEHVQIYEKIPSYFATKFSELNFFSQPSNTLQNERIVRWDFENLRPSENRVISYEIPTISSDFHAYADWPVYQVAVISGGSPQPISVSNFQIPPLLPGEEHTLSFSLFNSGMANKNVRVTLLAPNDWYLSSASFSVPLGARDISEQRIIVRPGTQVDPGTYTFRLRMEYDGTSIEQLLFVTVKEPLLVVAPSLREQFSAWLQRNLSMLVAMGALVLGLGAILYLLYRHSRIPSYNKKRVQELDTIERMMRDKDGG